MESHFFLFISTDRPVMIGPSPVLSVKLNTPKESVEASVEASVCFFVSSEIPAPSPPPPTLTC